MQLFFLEMRQLSSAEGVCALAEGAFQPVVCCLDPLESIKGVCGIGSQVGLIKPLKSVLNLSCALFFFHYYLCSFSCRYGLPVRYQALLLQADRKQSKRLEDELASLFGYLDPTATASKAEVWMDGWI